MRIGFVAEPYEESHASGMGYVILELMNNFIIEGVGHEFIFYSSKPVSTDFVSGVFTNVIVPRSFIKKWWWFFRYRGDADVLVFMVPLLPLWLPRHVKSVPMCQELGSQKIKPEHFLDRLIAFVRDSLLMPVALRRGTTIIAASQATKEDLVQYYGVAENKITLIYDGYQDLSGYATKATPIDIASPFFFFAGKVKPRKNVHRIVSAFIAFKERTHADCKLILAGDHSGDYYQEIVREIQTHNMGQDIQFVGYITTAQLYSYYTKAVACVFPSINEGFGMPILEAMSLGTPVITSNISSMVEVGGDAAVLVDPFSIQDISEGLERIYSDASLRARCIERGRHHAAKFSWTKAAREYIRMLEAL